VPGKPGLYFYKHGNYQAIFRELNGTDLFWLAENNFKLDSSAEVLELVLRLQVSTKDDILELELEDFSAVLKSILKKLVDKNLLTLETWFELVFIVGGKKFEPDYTPWLNTSITTLLGMSRIAQKYLTSI